jgi:phage terminase small subunit
MPLNEKQNHFAHAYVACGGNGRAAAIQAGYSHTSAAKRACDLLKVPEVQDIVQSHRDAVLKATEDFNVVEEIISLYRISVAAGSLAVAHNALATLGRLQNLEPARRVEVRNLDPDEMDRQIEHYLSIINHQNTKRPPEICLTRA